MNTLEQISNHIVTRYTQRYRIHGDDVKSLGWGTKEQQRYRFNQTLHCGVSFNNKSIIDVGCGFGDYFDFLVKENIKFKHYYGYDINPTLIQVAQKQHQSYSNNFHVKDILNEEECNIADIGVMLGILNFNLKNTMDNYEYSKKCIKNAFSLVNEVLIVDFLSDRLDSSYPEEDFVFYHSPVKMLEFALSLSNNVILKHDYSPIPQKEFMLIIKKDTQCK